MAPMILHACYHDVKIIYTIGGLTSRCCPGWPTPPQLNSQNSAFPCHKGQTCEFKRLFNRKYGDLHRALFRGFCPCLGVEKEQGPQGAYRTGVSVSLGSYIGGSCGVDIGDLSICWSTSRAPEWGLDSKLWEAPRQQA